MLAATNPKALMEMTKRLHGMETSLGFHAAVLFLAKISETGLVGLVSLWFHILLRISHVIVCLVCQSGGFCFYCVDDLTVARSLLGMQPTEYLMGLPDAELAKLIYRDDITIKHASRQRLADELQDKADGSAKNPEKMAVCDTNEKTQGAGALSKALVQYLLKAGGVYAVRVVSYYCI